MLPQDEPGCVSRITNDGSSAVEFALIVPFAALLVALAVEVALVGIRSIAGQHAAYRAARVSEVYQRALADDELYAMLDPALFRGGGVAPSDASSARMRVDLFSRPIINIGALDPALRLRRESPQVDALTSGLSEAALRGGDTPSPYCRDGEGYGVCGYPE